MSGVVALAAFSALAMPRAPALEGQSHSTEIRTFANIMAVAKTVRENCPGIEPDDEYLEALRRRLRVVEQDHAVFRSEARAAAETLKRALAEAPSRQAWCEAALRLYGPDGTLIPNLMGPEPKP